MPADVSDQLRDLAGWIDDRWTPQDPAALRDEAPMTLLADVPGPSRPGSDGRRGRVLAIAACVLLLVGLVAVAVRARDNAASVTVDQPLVPDAAEYERLGWRTTPDLPFTDRMLNPDAPSVWTGRELLLVGALVEVLSMEPRDLPDEGTKVFETPAYDPATNTWRTYPAPPVRMSGTVHAVWTGAQVLVVSSSGFTVESITDGSPSAPCTGTTGAATTVASLDPSTATWTVRAEPTVTAGTVTDLVWDGSRAWLVHADGCVLAYDPVADAYAAPIAPEHAAIVSATAGEAQLPRVDSAALAGRELYLSFHDTTGLVVIDTVDGSSRTLGAPPWVPSETVATSAGIVRIFATTEKASILDPATGRWRDLPKPPLAGRNLVSGPVWTGDRVVTWGGSLITPGRTDPSTTTWLTDGVMLDPVTGTWKAIPAGPDLGWLAASGWAGDRLVVWWGGNALGDPDGVLRAMTWQPPDASGRASAPGSSVPGTTPPAGP